MLIFTLCFCFLGRQWAFGWDYGSLQDFPSITHNQSILLRNPVSKTLKRTINNIEVELAKSIEFQEFTDLNLGGFIYAITNCGTHKEIIYAQSLNYCRRLGHADHGSYIIRINNIDDNSNTFNLLGNYYETNDCQGEVTWHFYHDVVNAPYNSVNITNNVITNHSSICHSGETYYTFQSGTFTSRNLASKSGFYQFQFEDICRYMSPYVLSGFVFYPLDTCLYNNDLKMYMYANSSSTFTRQEISMYISNSEDCSHLEEYQVVHADECIASSASTTYISILYVQDNPINDYVVTQPGYLHSMYSCGYAHDKIVSMSVNTCIQTSAATSSFNTLSKTSRSDLSSWLTMSQFVYSNSNCEGTGTTVNVTTVSTQCLYQGIYGKFIGGGLTSLLVNTPGVTLLLCSKEFIAKATFIPFSKCIYNDAMRKYVIVKKNTEGNIVYSTSQSSSCTNSVSMGLLPLTGCNDVQSFSYYAYQYTEPQLFPTPFDAGYDHDLPGFGYSDLYCGTADSGIYSQAVNICFQGSIRNQGSGSFYIASSVFDDNQFTLTTYYYVTSDCTGALYTAPFYGNFLYYFYSQMSIFSQSCIYGQAYHFIKPGPIMYNLFRTNGFSILRYTTLGCRTNLISLTSFPFNKCVYIPDISSYAYAYMQGTSVLVYVTATDSACTQSRQTHSFQINTCFNVVLDSNANTYVQMTKTLPSTDEQPWRPGYVLSVASCESSNSIMGIQSVNYCWRNDTASSYIMRVTPLTDGSFHMVGYKYATVNCGGEPVSIFYESDFLYYDSTPHRSFQYVRTCIPGQTQYMYSQASLSDSLFTRDGFVVGYANDSTCNTGTLHGGFYSPYNKCVPYRNGINLANNSNTLFVKYVANESSSDVKGVLYIDRNCLIHTNVNLTVELHMCEMLSSNVKNTFVSYGIRYPVAQADLPDTTLPGHIYRIENCGTSSLVITSQSVNVCWRITNSTGNVVASYITNVTSASTGTGVMALTRVYTTPDCSGIIQGYTPAVILQANRTANNIFSVPTLSKTINSILSALATRSPALYNIYSTTCISGKTQYRYLPGGMSADELNGDLNGVSLFYYANYNCSGEASELMSFYPLNQCIRHNNTLSSVTVFKYDSESAMVKLYSYVGGDIGSCSAVPSSLVLLESHSSNVCSVVGEIGGYMQQMGSMKWNVQTTASPTAFPSGIPSMVPTSLQTSTPTIGVVSSPTRVPIALSTRSPSRFPSGLPTTIPTSQVVYDLSISQTIVGCSFVDYTSNTTAYDLAIKHSMISCLDGIVNDVHAIRSFTVSAYSSNSAMRLLSVSDGITVNFVMETTQVVSSTAVRDLLTTNSDNGQLSQNLAHYGQIYAANQLSSVTTIINTVSVDTVTPTSSPIVAPTKSSASKSNSSLIIIVIAVVVGFLAVIGCTFLYNSRSKISKVYIANFSSSAIDNKQSSQAPGSLNFNISQHSSRMNS